MSNETQAELAAYKAKIDEKYATVRERHEATIAAQSAKREERKRKDHWLLIGPDGEIDGIIVRCSCGSATEAFEQFFPKKRERLASAEKGWHIEQDDVEGSRFEEMLAARRGDPE